MENSLEENFKNICKAIPTYALSDEIGLDTETSYILNLESEENYLIATEFIKRECKNSKIIDKKYIGKKIIIEFYSNGYSNGINDWRFCNHGTIEEYFLNAKITLERYMSNIEW